MTSPTICDTRGFLSDGLLPDKSHLVQHGLRLADGHPALVLCQLEPLGSLHGSCIEGKAPAQAHKPLLHMAAGLVQGALSLLARQLFLPAGSLQALKCRVVLAQEAPLKFCLTDACQQMTGKQCAARIRP